jgi:hypothetical protein
MPFMVLLGFVLSLPNLRLGLVFDDFLQWALISGHVQQKVFAGSPLGLFNLVDGDPETVQAMRDSGRLLWVAADTLRINFWRPLAELTHWLDFTLWPDAVWLMHLHSLIWYALLLWSLGALYRRIMPDLAHANLALLIYALSSVHGLAVAWLAARNQLMSTCLTAMTLVLFHDWQQGRGVWRGVGAWISLVLALACAEASVAAMAFLVAYAATMMGHRSWRERILPLLPFLLTVAVWRVACTAAGYGSEASGSYIDPVKEAGRFIEMVAVRLPVLLAAPVFGLPPNGAASSSYGVQALYAAVCAADLFLLGWLAAKRGLWAQAPMRFLAFGTLLTVVPACAVAPQGRVLIHAEIGQSALVAIVVLAMWPGRGPEVFKRRLGVWLERLVLGWLVVLHLVISPVVGLGSTLWGAPMINRVTWQQALFLPEADAQPHHRVVVLNSPSPNLFFYTSLMRARQGLPNPRSMWSLAVAQTQPLTLTVLNERSLRLSSTMPFDDIINRDVRSHPFHPGDVVRLDGMNVVVEQVDPSGAPTVARFEFALPLNDPSWRFYVWRPTGGYVPMVFPAAGQPLVLPVASYGELLKQVQEGEDTVLAPSPK